MNGLLTNVDNNCMPMCTDSSTIRLAIQEAFFTNNNILNVLYQSDELHFDLLRLSLWWNWVTRSTPHAIERMILCCNSIIVGLNSRSTAMILKGTNLNILTHMSILVYVGNFRLFSSILQNV